MLKEQILIGLISAFLCALGLWNDRWFLANTKKGQRMVRWFGHRKALWILRGVLCVGILLGFLLAGGIIHPIRW